jgi:hypothetical protein
MENPIMRKAITISGLLSAVTLQSARAGFWIDWPDGESSYVTDGTVFVALFAVIAGIVLCSLLSSTSGNGSSDSSLSAAEQAQQYDDEAAQYRAMSRRLDAETNLADSLIKAKRTRAELDDVEEFLRDDKRRRRR